jgi:hypothetical protein
MSCHKAPGRLSHSAETASSRGVVAASLSKRKRICKDKILCYLVSVAIQGGSDCYNPSCHITKVEGYAQGVLKMLSVVVITGVLGGIAALVLFGAICEGIGCTRKLHDRYHE